MKHAPLPVLPSIRFTSIEIREATAKGVDGRLFGGELCIRAAVPDRQAPERTIEIKFGVGLPPHWSHMTEASRVGWLRSKMLDLVAHEIDEMLFVAGLGRDPHERERAARILPPIEIKLKPLGLKNLVVDAPEDLTKFVPVPELEP